MRHFSEIAARLLRLILTGLCRLWTGVRTHWVGCSPAPLPRIYFANHSSHMDGLVIWTGLPSELRERTSLVAAKDYWESTPLRIWLTSRVFRTVLVERGRTPQGRGRRTGRHPLDGPVSILQRGESLILFPEGTRHAGEDIRPFRSGLYHLAKMCPEAELVPVYLDNFYRVLPKGCRLMVPILCSVIIGAPLRLEARENRRDFLKRMKEALEQLKAGNT